MINLNHSEHAVVEARPANDHLFELVLERNGLDFLPGDCTAVYTDTGQSRPYSIASGTQENELRFLVRKMDGGEVSPWLTARKPGDTVRITPPFGWFRPGQDIGDAPFAFIATGTGIAPFLAYRNTFEKPPVQILYGVRRETDAIGFDRLSNWCPVRLAVSREKSASHFHGRLTGLLDQLELAPGTHYYCCGLESMVNDVGAWLRKNGVPLMNIHREVFFHG
jgi:ferredoxin-NADP reductase